MNQVAVVVVNFNCLDDLPQCIETILTSDTAPEVVVVDNASSDGSTDVIARRFPTVRIIRNPDNRGLAAGNNQGIAATRAPFVVMANPDIRFERTTLSEIVRCFDRHEKAALVGPRLFDDDGALRTSVAALPRLRDALRGRYWWSWWSHDTEQRVGQVIEACYAVKREALAFSGALDERFFLYWEGTDLARRLQDHGWEAWFCPSAVARHRGGGTVDKHPWRRIVWSQQGAYRYFRSHSRVPRPVLAALFSSRAVLKFAFHALRGIGSQNPPVNAELVGGRD
jgi:GT2 family glycosyltransferase